MLLPKLHTQGDQLRLSVWLICRELSHIRGPLRMPPWSLDCLCFTVCCTTASLPSRDPQSRNVHHHRHLPPHCQRCWPLQSHGFLALMPIHILPSIVAHCTPVEHHRGHYPNLPPGQSRKSTPRCQQKSMMPCLANGNSPSVVPFQCYPVKCPLLLSLSLEPKLTEA